jgi:hypothetical protein
MKATETTKGEKVALNVVIEPEIVRMLDDYRFANRHASRAAALRALIRGTVKSSGPATTATKK